MSTSSLRLSLVVVVFLLSKTTYLTLSVYIGTWLTRVVVGYRLVPGVSAGMGSLHQAGHSQHADDVPGVVDLRAGGVPGWPDQRGGAGSPVNRLRAGHAVLHGDSSQELLCSHISMTQLFFFFMFEQKLAVRN